MSLDKKIKYQDLVKDRKNCSLCFEKKFINQSEIKNGEFDTCEIGNYSTWANSLNAEVIIVGQDYANQEIFIRDKGDIEPKTLDENSSPNDYSTATNYYLRELTKEIGFDIGLPTKTSSQKIFLTNAVLCLKQGNMSASVPDEVFKNCGTKFLNPLVEIISPKVIIPLGFTATKATILAFSNKIENSNELIKKSFKELFRIGKIQIKDSLVCIFPVYHPGKLGQLNRRKIENSQENGFELMKQDWEKIKKELNIFKMLPK